MKINPNKLTQQQANQILNYLQDSEKLLKSAARQDSMYPPTRYSVAAQRISELLDEITEKED